MQLHFVKDSLEKAIKYGNIALAVTSWNKGLYFFTTVEHRIIVPHSVLTMEYNAYTNNFTVHKDANTWLRPDNITLPMYILRHNFHLPHSTITCILAAKQAYTCL